MVLVTNSVSMALVAVLCMDLITSTSASSGLAAHSPQRWGSRSHHHRVMKRTVSSKLNCPEEKSHLGSYIRNQIQRLSNASARQGGKEQVKEASMNAPGMSEHIEVKAQTSPGRNGFSRSWSWSWLSHTTSSSSSSSFSSSTSTSGRSSESLKKETQDQSDRSSDHNKRDAKTHHPAAPQAKHVETHAQQTRHSSDSSRTTEVSTKDKNGHVVDTTKSTHTSSSSSSSSYSVFLNVFKYVITGNTQQSDNIAPFANAQVQWKSSPANSAALTSEPPVGQPIARPATANICNRRFPLTDRTYTAKDMDKRFSQTWPKEALDPVSKMALDLHNQERARYGLQPLEWNAELANMAACWADLKAYGHSQDRFCTSGENIAMGVGDPCYSDPMEGMKNGIMSFLDEDRNWAQDPHESDRTGHWSQIVWKDTRFVGCAVSQRMDFMQSYSPNENPSMYIVCEYYPPGNVQGQIERQVPAVKPMSKLRSACSANERHGR